MLFVTCAWIMQKEDRIVQGSLRVWISDAFADNQGGYRLTELPSVRANRGEAPD
jgi:hypothetical protein